MREEEISMPSRESQNLFQRRTACLFQSGSDVGCPEEWSALLFLAQKPRVKSMWTFVSLRLWCTVFSAQGRPRWREQGGAKYRRVRNSNSTCESHPVYVDSCAARTEKKTLPALLGVANPRPVVPSALLRTVHPPPHTT